jgi:hypothetical protein
VFLDHRSREMNLNEANETDPAKRPDLKPNVGSIRCSKYTPNLTGRDAAPPMELRASP